MKLTAVVLCCLASALIMIGCAAGPTNSSAPTASAPSSSTPASATTATVDPASNARAIYARDCESCHGAKGDGGQVTVDNKRLKVPSLKTERAIKHTDEDYIKQISKGGDGMPAFSEKLKQEEIDSLVKLIRREIQGG